MTVGTGNGLLGSNMIEVSAARSTAVDLSEWRIVFDGAQIWLGREDREWVDAAKMRLRPVLRVRELPVPVQGKPGVMGLVLHCGSVLNRLPALPYLDVARERSTIPVLDMQDDAYWRDLIESTLLQFRARSAGLTI